MSQSRLCHRVAAVCILLGAAAATARWCSRHWAVPVSPAPFLDGALAFVPPPPLAPPRRHGNTPSAAARPGGDVPPGEGVRRHGNPPPAAVRAPRGQEAVPVEARRGAWAHVLEIADLTRLSPHTQAALSLLLLLPLGALIVAFLHQIVGVRTFGTFAPCLLALSLICANFWTGLTVLGVALAAGLLARRLLGLLTVLSISRLGLILTAVVLAVVLSVSALSSSGRASDSVAVLLPVVILAGVIERFTQTAEEDDPREAFKLLLSTLAVALGCYAVFRWTASRRTFLIYPELHLVTFGLLIYLGRYTGYRLTELWRFRGFLERAGRS